MKFLSTILFSFLTLFLSGCGEVLLNKPLDIEPVQFPEKFSGIWTQTLGNDSQKIEITVLDAKSGKIKMTPADKTSKEKPIFAQLKEHNDNVYANFSESEKGDSDYHWALVGGMDEAIVCYIPDIQKFKSLVEKEILPGKIVNNDKIILHDIKSEHLNILESQEHGFPYHWKHPVIFIKDKEEPQKATKQPN